MAETTLTIYRNATAPVAMLAVPDLELAGSQFEIAIQLPDQTVILTSLGGDLVVDTEARTISWPYTVERAAQIPLGRIAPFDVFRLIAGSREKIGAGRLNGVGAGEFPGSSVATLAVAGPQGPRRRPPLFLPKFSRRWAPRPAGSTSPILTNRGGCKWQTIFRSKMRRAS
jgi:hypothetical protein